MRSAPKTGQFRRRRPAYDTWGLAQFIRVGNTYSEKMHDLFYCENFSLRESRGVWAWGRCDGFAVQMGAAGLEQFYAPITEAEAAAIAEEELRERQATWNATYPAHAHGLTIREYGKARATVYTPAQLTKSYRTKLLVIDYITTATETAAAVVVRDTESGQERLTTDPAEIRALHDHATAKSCGNGSYTVEIPGGMTNLKVKQG